LIELINGCVDVRLIMVVSKSGLYALGVKANSSFR